MRIVLVFGITRPGDLKISLSFQCSDYDYIQLRKHDFLLRHDIKQRCDLIREEREVLKKVPVKRMFLYQVSPANAFRAFVCVCVCLSCNNHQIHC